RQLQVLVELRRVIDHRVPGRDGVRHPELRDQRDADADLVAGEDLLALDGLAGLADVDAIDAATLPAPPGVAAGGEHFDEPALVVEEAALVLADDDDRAEE